MTARMASTRTLLGELEKAKKIDVSKEVFSTAVKRLHDVLMAPSVPEGYSVDGLFEAVSQDACDALFANDTGVRHKMYAEVRALYFLYERRLSEVATDTDKHQALGRLLGVLDVMTSGLNYQPDVIERQREVIERLGYRWFVEGVGELTTPKKLRPKGMPMDRFNRILEVFERAGIVGCQQVNKAILICMKSRGQCILHSFRSSPTSVNVPN